MYSPPRPLHWPSLEQAARWSYAIGTSLAATVTTLELGPHALAGLMAICHVLAAVTIAISRRPQKQVPRHKKRKRRPQHIV